MRLLPAAAVLLCTVLASASPVSEAEPNGFTSPLPQDLGVLGAGGFQISGTLDPTSPSGLDPGDRDGFSFTMEADGAVSATVDDAGAGETFVLALSEETPEGPVIVASSIGPAPLVLARPGLVTGKEYRVGVAALSDGDPLPYTLDVMPRNDLPPWSGAPCPGFLPEAEPDGDARTATVLGDFTGVLCGSGSIAEIAPPGSGLEGDPDLFRFRQVLPVPVRVTVNADPGTLHVTVYALTFVGIAPVTDHAFGAYAQIDTPALSPGMTYFVEFRGEQGTAPLDYTFHLEPVAPPPPPPAEPLDLTRGRLRLSPGPAFRVTALFEQGLGAGLSEGIPFSVRVRGMEQSFGGGVLRGTRRGGLRYRAPAGVPGLRSLRFDPERGVLRIRGRGLDLQGDETPGDPMLVVELTLDDLRLAAAEEGEFSPDGRILKVR